jgi:anti-anti-sigma regulatory factor
MRLLIRLLLQANTKKITKYNNVMLDYSHDAELNVLNITFKGKLDITASLSFKPEIDNLLMELQAGVHENPLKVNFDFHSVDFITSAFVGICVSTAKKVGIPNFSISNTNPFIKRTFKIAGLDGELNVS